MGGQNEASKDHRCGNSSRSTIPNNRHEAFAPQAPTGTTRPQSTAFLVSEISARQQQGYLNRPSATAAEAAPSHSPAHRIPDRSTWDGVSRSASVEQCEEIINFFLQALNERDFSDLTWQNIAPHMRVDWGILFLQREDNETLSLHEWLRSVRLFAENYPHYHFEISNVTTMVDEKGGTAESLLNVKLSGVYPDIVRQSVAGFGFLRKGHKWEAVRHGAFAGSGFI